MIEPAGKNNPGPSVHSRLLISGKDKTSKHHHEKGVPR
jgi:hypothetical protein